MKSFLKYFSASVLALATQAAFAQVDLGAASSFAVLGASTVTNTGPTIVTGDLGVSPGSAVTGFPPGIVNGTIYTEAASLAGTAQTDATTAYNFLADQKCDTNLTSQDLGGMTLTPGVYCFDSSAQLTGILNLTGAGPWIFQIESTLTTASNSSVLVNGSGFSQVCSPGAFWAVGSSATLGTGTQFQGVIIAVASDTLTTSANVSGGVFALNGAVTLDTNLVNACSSGSKSKSKCNQGVGNGPENCDPGNSNQDGHNSNPFNDGTPARNTNDELGGTPGDPGREGGNIK